MINRIGAVVLGLAATLGFWTLKGNLSAASDDARLGQGKIPSQIWGGGTQVTIDSSSSEAGTLSITFETNLPVDDSKHRFAETWQHLPAGAHSVTIDVPSGVSSTVERRVDEGAHAGSTVEVGVKIAGREISRDTRQLEAAPQEGYGFAAQLHFEDLAAGTTDANN